MSMLVWMIVLPAIAMGFIGALCTHFIEPLLRFARHPAERRIGYLLVAALPLILTCITAIALAALASSKALGWIVDHCLIHGTVEHPHLCFEHLPAVSVGVLPVAFAIVVTLLLVTRLIRFAARHLRLRRAVRQLTALSKKNGVLCRLSDAAPTAFVAGIRRPRIFLSMHLLARLSAHERRIVVAHESAHLRARDPLMRAVLELLLLCHRSTSAQAIRSGWVEASEECADTKVATRFGATDTALALLRVLRITGGSSSGAVACIQGASPMARILRLKEGSHFERRQRSVVAVATGVCLATASVIIALHHPIETLFGFLIR